MGQDLALESPGPMCAEPWSRPNLPLQAEVPPASHPGRSFRQTEQRRRPAAVSPSVHGTAAAAASAGASAGTWLRSLWYRGPGFCNGRPVRCGGVGWVPSYLVNSTQFPRGLRDPRAAEKVQVGGGAERAGSRTGSCSPCPPASQRGGQLSGSVCKVRSPPGL